MTLVDMTHLIDKLYINKYMIRPGMLYKAQEPADTPEYEYIRKDALLEWLEGKMTIEGATEGIVGGYDMALKDVINKLNSM